MCDSVVSAAEGETESSKRPYKGGRQYGGGISKNEMKRRKLALNPGAKGVYLTVFTPTKARDALREFNNILNRFLHASEAGADANTPKSEGGFNESNASNEGTEISMPTVCRSNEEIVGSAKNDAEKAENTLGFVERKPDENSDVVDIDRRINLELEEIKETNKRFIHMPDIFKNSTFMQFPRSNDVPSSILWKLLTEVKSDPQKYYSRFICRMIPIDHTCKPHMDDFKKMMKPLITDFFKLSEAAKSATEEVSALDAAAATAARSGNLSEVASTKTENGKNENDTTASIGIEQTEKITWSINYNNRNSMKTIERQDVYDFITDLMGSKHYKVNLTKAKYTIIVDVSPLICGVSIVEDYLEYFRFNFHRLSHPEEEANQKMRETQQLKTQNKANKQTVVDDTASNKKGKIETTEEVSSDSVAAAS